MRKSVRILGLCHLYENLYTRPNDVGGSSNSRVSYSCANELTNLIPISCSMNLEIFVAFTNCLQAVSALRPKQYEYIHPPHTSRLRDDLNSQPRAFV